MRELEILDALIQGKMFLGANRIPTVVRAECPKDAVSQVRSATLARSSKASHFGDKASKAGEPLLDAIRRFPLPAERISDCSDSLCFFLVATEVGFRRGRALGTDITDRSKPQLATLQTAILGLLALLLAFCFSMAESR
jgi:hypothetical protein